MSRAALAAALILLVASCGMGEPAFADDAEPACVSLDPLLDATAKDGLDVHPVPETILPDLVRLYNKAPPKSTSTFEGGGYVESDESVLVVLLRGGMVCGSLTISPSLWAHLRAKVGERT